MAFVDEVEVSLRAGKGGDGKLSFRHEKFRPLGGPDGGDGGDGGDIVLKASLNQDTLATFRYKKILKAEDGQPGGKSKKHGKNGQDLELDIPVGTVVVDKQGTIIVDFVDDGQRAVLARGGKGGYGNAHFVSSTRQAPRVAENGEPGESIDAVFTLKMIADVGIIGLPNAGKSTFLSVISNAKPEIADYPFTTLQPNLGVVDIDTKNSLLFADIPGLIEGASQGKGLGDEFLRHVERTRVLVHLIDIYNDNVVTAYKTIIEELKAYLVDLSQKPQVVALSKIDGFDKKELAKKVTQLKKITPKNTPVLAISSTSGEGVQELLRHIQKTAKKPAKASLRKKNFSELPVIRLKEDENSWDVKKDGKNFVVTGKKIERFATRTRFGDYHSEQRLRDIIRKMGIAEELERQGIESGQQITIGSSEIGRLEY